MSDGVGLGFVMQLSGISTGTLILFVSDGSASSETSAFLFSCSKMRQIVVKRGNEVVRRG